MEKALRDAVALHETHRAGVAVRHDRFWCTTRDFGQTLAREAQRFVPADWLEAPFAFFADPPHRRA